MGSKHLGKVTGRFSTKRLPCNSTSSNSESVSQPHTSTALDRLSAKYKQLSGSRMPPITKGKIRLYSNRFGPYAQRVQLVLDAKKIPHDVVNINLSHKPDWLYDKVRSGNIPALEVDNGDILTESSIIIDYLDEKYPNHPLYPQDPLQKAKDRLLINQFNKIINAMSNALLHTNRSHLEDHQSVITNGLATFERELLSRKGPFFGGNKPGMLDYMIWPWCERADVLKLFGKQFLLKTNNYKHLMNWRTLMRDDPAVKKNYLSPQHHIKYVESYRSGVPTYDFD